jgi:hypothetical protein
MMRLTNAGALVQVAFALGLALVAAPIVRNLTTELNETLGRDWPFSIGHCASAATPGCGDAAVLATEGRAAVHVRTGHL